jgi:hypothetical protein
MFHKIMTKLSTSLTLALILAVLVAPLALADFPVPDGDGAVPIPFNGNPLAFGTVCLDESVSETALIAIRRQGGNNNTFANGSTVTISVKSVSSDLEASISNPNTIILPAAWVDQSPNTVSEDYVSSIVTFTPSSVGPFTGEIVYSSFGENANGNSLTRDSSMQVTANVMDCTPPDDTPPVITPTITGTLGNNGWYTSDVTVSWTVVDDESDITSTDDCDPTTIDYDTAGVTLTCEATSAGGTASESVTIKRDATSPSITWNGGPAAGASYYFDFVPAAPDCEAVDSLSGPDGCTVTGYGTIVGSHTLTATAYDVAGNTATEERTYTVLAWTLTGFYQPVNMGDDVVNTVKGGSTVPLKFNVYAGENELTDTSAIESFITLAYTCGANQSEGEVEFVTTGNTSLRYDEVDGQFIQNWKTPKLPGKCFLVTMTTQDGSTIMAYFKLK